MCLKQSFSHSNWVLQAILSLTVFSNYDSGSSYFDTTLLPNCTKFCSVFYVILCTCLEYSLNNYAVKLLGKFELKYLRNCTFFVLQYLSHCVAFDKRNRLK